MKIVRENPLNYQEKPLKALNDALLKKAASKRAAQASLKRS
jgi:hypothetical protein